MSIGARVNCRSCHSPLHSPLHLKLSAQVNAVLMAEDMGRRRTAVTRLPACWIKQGVEQDGYWTIGIIS